MEEEEGEKAEDFMNGNTARRIISFLFHHAHDQNTVEEINDVGYILHEEMQNMYNKGQRRADASMEEGND